MDNQEQLNNLRHTTAHLLAAAVVELFPGAKPTIGPVIENGFYYDIELNKTISEEELPKIEAKMGELVRSWDKAEKREISADEARKIFADNPYKLELINDLEKDNQPITLYKTGNFEDLCRGGHLEKPNQEIKAFKLLSLAGAYWRGDEKNKMLTRIYGTAFSTQEELDNYLNMLEEAKKRDHRRIGQDLGLFVFSDLVGKGLPLLTAKGATIRRELERFVVDEEIRRGYQHVVTPHLAKVDLYRTSGHYPYYKDTMYPPMKIDEEELILRPMTCPHHFMIYKSQTRSYKDLPLKIAELASQFRYEKSGELTGLSRVRTFCLADAHIVAAPEQAKGVIKDVLDLIDYVNKALGLKKREDYRYRLSLGDRSDEKKYYQDDAAWDYAENVLRGVLTETKQPFSEAGGEAAFYGPKIDIQVKTVSGKEETAFTIQYDFVMPKRFDLKYIDKDGKEKEPIVIHRSSIGAFERTMAFLLEHYAGALPAWLSPVQVQIIPITDRQNEYSQKVFEQLLSVGIRAELDDRSEKMQAKIRDAQMQKVPYMLIIGGREQEAGQVTVRTRAGDDLGVMTIDKFISKITEEIKEKKA